MMRYILFKRQDDTGINYAQYLEYHSKEHQNEEKYETNQEMHCYAKASFFGKLSYLFFR